MPSRNEPVDVLRQTLPSPIDPSQAVSRHALYKWMKKAMKRIGLGDAPGIGFHRFGRKFASELMGLPMKELMALGGWRDPDTILTCYQHAALVLSWASSCGYRH